MAGAGGNRIARSGSLSGIWFVAGENRLVCGLPVPHSYGMYLRGVRVFQRLPYQILGGSLLKKDCAARRSAGDGHHGSGSDLHAVRPVGHRTGDCGDGADTSVRIGSVSCTLHYRDAHGAQEEAELARRPCGYGKRAPGGSVSQTI